MKRLWAALLAAMMLLSGVQISLSEGAAPLGRVAAGEKHVLLLSGGACVGLGDNAYGQCDVGKWQGVLSIAAGARHSVALFEDGTCAAVGDNEYGQCGVEGWRDIVSIAAGENHTLGLKRDGTCVAAGIQGTYEEVDGDWKQLTFNPAHSPCDVAGWQEVAQIAAGGGLSLSLTRDGTVLAAGDTEDLVFYEAGEDDPAIFYGLSTWKDIKTLSVGPENTVLALFDDGTARYNGLSCAYDPWEANACSVCNPGIDRFVDLDKRTLYTWTDIVALYSYGAKNADSAGACGVTFGLCADGTVKMAGEDTFGLIEVTKWTDIVDMAVGLGFVVGVHSDGTLVYAGKGDCRMPQLPDINGVTDLSVQFKDYGYAVGVKPDGTLVAASDELADYWWDARLDGIERMTNTASVACAPNGILRLLTDGTVETNNERFAALDGLPNVVQIAAGGLEDDDFALVLTDAGDVISAGSLTIDWKNVLSIAAGRRGAACVLTDGTVAVAGNIARDVAGTEQWTDIAALALGDSHIVGLKKDGTCVSAGENPDGRCDVDAWQNVTAIAAGARHTLALRRDGTCVAVGSQTVEYDGEAVASYALNVSAWQNIAAIRAAEGLSVGIAADGEVFLAGYNTVDISGVCTYRLWEGTRARQDAPMNEQGENLQKVKATVEAARTDYEKVLAFVLNHGETARRIMAAHPEYDDVWGEFEGLLLYKKDGLYGFLRPDGSVALEAKYTYIDRKPSGGMYVLQNEDGLYGFADLDGVLRIPCQFLQTDGFTEYGCARVSVDDSVPRCDSPWIDRDGSVVFTDETAYKRYADAQPIPDPPRVRYTSTGNDSDHDDALEGYLDTATEAPVYPLFFDNAYDFENGIGKIKLLDQSGYINEAFELLSDIAPDQSGYEV